MDENGFLLINALPNSFSLMELSSFRVSVLMWLWYEVCNCVKEGNKIIWNLMIWSCYPFSASFPFVPLSQPLFPHAAQSTHNIHTHVMWMMKRCAKMWDRKTSLQNGVCWARTACRRTSRVEISHTKTLSCIVTSVLSSLRTSWTHTTLSEMNLRRKKKKKKGNQRMKKRKVWRRLIMGRGSKRCCNFCTLRSGVEKACCWKQKTQKDCVVEAFLLLNKQINQISKN